MPVFRYLSTKYAIAWPITPQNLAASVGQSNCGLGICPVCRVPVPIGRTPARDDWTGYSVATSAGRWRCRRHASLDRLGPASGAGARPAARWMICPQSSAVRGNLQLRRMNVEAGHPAAQIDTILLHLAGNMPAMAIPPPLACAYRSSGSGGDGTSQVHHFKLSDRAYGTTTTPINAY